MRPQAYKNLSYTFLQKDISGFNISWEILSFIFLYIDLFCFIFFSICVLSTHQRISAFFHDGLNTMPYLTKLLLGITSYEYMGACTLAGVFLIIKERMPSKTRSCVINAIVLVTIWVTIFLYIWGMSLPFNR